MGGKIVIFRGYFRQVLPVVSKGGRAQIIEACIENAQKWPKIKVSHLKTNMRAKPSEKEFAAWLLQSGNNEIKSEIGNDIIRVSNVFISNDSLVSHVFGNCIEFNSSAYYNRAVVSPFNVDCNSINEEVLHLIPGSFKEYNSVDTLLSDDDADTDFVSSIPIEYLHSIMPSGMPPHVLKLKVGVIVMLIKNMHMAFGLVNGVRIILREMHDKIIKLEVNTGASKNQVIYLPKIDLVCTAFQI